MANLGQGPRNLVVKLVTNGNEVSLVLGKVVRNMNVLVRDGVLGNYVARVKSKAKSNLRDQTERLGGADATGSRGRLAASIKEGRSRGDQVIIVYGEGLKYARMHDKPQGHFEPIVIRNAPNLVFPNRRSPLTPKPIIRVKSSERPTSGFMSDAVASANKEIPSLIKTEVVLVAHDFDTSGVSLNAKGGSVWRFGSISKGQAMERGLIEKSPHGRRDYILTQFGKQHIARRRR